MSDQPLSIVIDSPDRELGIVLQLVRIIEALHKDEQARVIGYLVTRFSTQPKQE